MRLLAVVGTLAVVALLSACSNWQNTAIPSLLGLNLRVVDPGPAGRRIDEGGVFANFFPAHVAGNAPAVLLLGGSEGGLSPDETDEIKDLVQAGFSVLYQCYFGCPGTPRKLVGVPLETFDRGLAFLRAEPGVDPHRIAILGESKGAEAALLVGTRDTGLKAVVAAKPSSIAWPGIELTLGQPPGWTSHGKPIPYLHYAFFSFFTDGMRGIYTGALPDIGKHPDAVIPVERIVAPILLICGEADTLWPSCPMAAQISSRLRSKGRPPAIVLQYKDAGHKVFGTPIDKSSAAYAELGSVGGTVDGNAAARADSWPRAIEFLKAAMNPLPQTAHN